MRVWPEIRPHRDRIRKRAVYGRPLFLKAGRFIARAKSQSHSGALSMAKSRSSRIGEGARCIRVKSRVLRSVHN